MRDLFRNGPSFYGQWRVYRDEASKEEAREWLGWWKEYMVKTLECVGIELISEDWIDRDNIPPMFGGPDICTLGLKLGMR